MSATGATSVICKQVVSAAVVACVCPGCDFGWEIVELKAHKGNNFTHGDSFDHVPIGIRHLCTHQEILL